MRQRIILTSLAASVATAVALSATALPPSTFASQGPSERSRPAAGNAEERGAEQGARKSAPSCSCGRDDPSRIIKPWPSPKLADARPVIDPREEIAALEAIHQALTDTEDGGSHVWHGKSGRISGVIQPTSSFRDRRGLICRHVVLLLASGERSRRAEGVACRSIGGAWALEG